MNKKQSIFLMVLILGSLTAFGPLSMDMYLPALPQVTDDFNTTASLAQLSITACLLGLGAGQLLFGPLSDMLGRKKPLLITLFLYSISSILCAISPTISLFILLRFIQGFTGAAGIVIARASARDMYDGKDLTKFIALLALVNGAAPILAPLFGGIILNWFTWNVVFYILAIIGIIMLLAVLILLPETLEAHARQDSNLKGVFLTFKSLIDDQIFFGIALVQSFVSMAMFAYIAGSPFVLQNIYHVTAQQFSYIFALNGLGIILAAQMTGKLAFKYSEAQLMKVGIAISFIGSVLFIIAIVFNLHLSLVLLALFLVVSSVGIVNTTAFSLGLERRGDVAGSASAFLGILPFGGGALVSPLVGLKGEYSAEPLAIVILLCACFSLLIYFIFLKNTNIKESYE